MHWNILFQNQLLAEETVMSLPSPPPAILSSITHSVGRYSSERRVMMSGSSIVLLSVLPPPAILSSTTHSVGRYSSERRVMMSGSSIVLLSVR